MAAALSAALFMGCAQTAEPVAEDSPALRVRRGHCLPHYAAGELAQPPVWWQGIQPGQRAGIELVSLTAI